MRRPARRAPAPGSRPRSRRSPSRRSARARRRPSAAAVSFGPESKRRSSSPSRAAPSRGSRPRPLRAPFDPRSRGQHLRGSRTAATIRPMKLVLAALAAALVVTSAASASPSIRFGVQDDAYLAPGPSLEPNLLTLDQLGVGLVRYLVNWRQVAPTKPRHPADPGDPAYDWTAADATLGALHARGITVLATLVRTPGLGQRRARPERRADEQVRARRLRGRRRQALPVAAPVGDLERAEPAVVPEAELAAALRAAAAQPGLRRAAGARPGEPRGRRRDLAALDEQRALAGRVHARHVGGARPARRLLAPPVRGHARRDAVRLRPRRLPLLHRRADDGEPGEADPGGEARLRPEADLADRVRLRDEPAGPERRLVGLAGAVRRRRRRCGRPPRRTSTCSSSSCSRTKAGRTAGRAG